MSGDPDGILPNDVVDRARQIASLVRNGELAALVGAGISASCGVPPWGRLVDRMIRGWQQWDKANGGDAATRLSPEDYLRFVRHVFGSDLGVVSYLRSVLPSDETLGGLPTLSQLLYAALYLDENSGRFYTPEPNQIHRQLIALFRDFPRRIWTTNYDYLLEQAVWEAEGGVQIISSLDHRDSPAFVVAHLHGVLPPPAWVGSRDEAPEPTPVGQMPVILAEDDYHAVSSDVLGWTNRELFRLLDEYHVLIVGASLTDLNLRRILLRSHTSDKQHFAVLRSVPSKEIEELGIAPAHACDADKWREDYWDHHNVQLVRVPDHGQLLPFLMRLRYESYGDGPGDLWKRGAEYYRRIAPWDGSHQRVASAVLGDAVHKLGKEFDLQDQSELLEVGIFLLKDDARTLEVVFRGGDHDPHPYPSQRVFSADPDRPEGMAGHVFVTSEFVRISREDPSFSRNLPALKPSMPYQGLVSGPIIDWPGGGIPVGVIYLTLARTDGEIFRMALNQPTNGRRTLQDVYLWLHALAWDLLDTLQS